MRGARWFRRRWRLIWPGRNSLARREDRVEAGFLVAAIMLCLAAIPVAIAAGSAIYAREMPIAQAEMADRHPSTAVTLAGTAPATAGLAVSPPESAPGRWRLPDGQNRTGTVQADPGTPAGAQVPIWLDRNGNLVEAPMTTVDAMATAWGLGLLVFALAVAMAAGLARLARFFLDRRRAEQWAREWERFGAKPSRP